MNEPDEATDMLDAPTGKAVLTVAEAAALARCGRRAIYAMIHDGRIPAVRVGVAFRIPTRPFCAHLERGDTTLIEDEQR